VNPDVAFVHVDLPRLDGFHVIDSMGERARRPAVVLLGRRPSDAVRAFGAGATDFLQIPFDAARLAKALSRVRQRVQVSPEASSAARQPKDPTLDRIALPVGGRLLMISLSDLLWVKASRRQSELHLREGILIADIAFGRLEQKLPRGIFLQINRSVIVRHDFVREARPKSHGDHWVVLEDGQEAVLSRNRRHGVLRRLGWTG